MTAVRCEVLGDRIAISWDGRFPGDNAMAKEVPGWKWEPYKKLWTYPKNLATCRLLRMVYTDMLVLGPGITRWAREEKDRIGRMSDLAHANDAVLTRVPEALPLLDAAMASRPYQRVGARFLADNREVLLADEPTLGKTIQYLGAVAEAGLDSGMHLVIGPKSSLFSTWAYEIHKWTPWHAFWMPDGRDRRERMLELFMADQYEGPKFLVVNFQMLQIQILDRCKKCDQWGPTPKEEKEQKRTQEPWFPINHYTEAHNTKSEIYKQPWPELFEIEWSSVCIDEAHLSLLGVRTPTRGRKNTQEGNGLVSLRVREGGLKVGSTGTPLRGHALNFWSTFHWLRPKEYSSKWAFADRFLEITDNGFGKSIGDVRDDREDLLQESLRTIMLRRTKAEVQPELPDDVYLDHWVEMTDLHKKQYEAMVQDGELEIEGGALSTNGILAEHTRRKQWSFGAWQSGDQGLEPMSGESNKTNLLIRLLENRGVTGDPKTDFRIDGGWKYIIGSQLTTIIDYVERELTASGIECMKITGSVTSKKRDQAKIDWQEDDSPTAKRVLLINTKAGGTSLTLDAMCDEMFVLDETWVDDDQFQLEGRIRNREVEKRVATRSYHYIRTVGTIEEEIAKSGLTQNEFQKKILDRGRGFNVKNKETKKA